MAERVKTIYFDNGNGTISESGVCMKSNGDYCKNSKANKVKQLNITPEQAMSMGYMVVSRTGEQLSNSNSMNQNPFGVQGAETPDGRAQFVRGQVPGLQIKNQTINIVFTNTHATLSFTTTIGEGFKTAAAKLGLPALNGVVLVNGKQWGASSLSIIDNVSTGVSYDLHKLHIQSAVITVSGTPANATTGTPATVASVTDNDNFFNNGDLQGIVGSIVGLPPSQADLGLTMLTDSSTLAPYIRLQNDHRGAFSATEGYLITIPPLTQVSITWNVSAIGNGYLVNKNYML